MTERYPDDATLLAMQTDAETGVEMIATGTSPYYLEFRKLIQRLLLSCKRANDLRLYADGDLSVGVRPGRCVIADTAIHFTGTTGYAITNNATTYLWLDSSGAVQSGTSAFPADRTSYMPLAEVTAATGAITSITDMRGEAFLAIPDLAMLGIDASAADIDQVIDGVNASVTAAALNTLTAGNTTTADLQHTHSQYAQNGNAEQTFSLINSDIGSSANVAIAFDLPGRLLEVTRLRPDNTTGWLTQAYGTTQYALLGAATVQWTASGNVTASSTANFLGAVPHTGLVSDVILTVGTNLQSDADADGLAATVKINGAVVTSTNPAITSATGSGAKSTAQSDGTPAAIKSDGTEAVTQGDRITVDITRTAAGNIATEAADVSVIVVIRPGGPE